MFPPTKYFSEPPGKTDGVFRVFPSANPTADPAKTVDHEVEKEAK